MDPADVWHWRHDKTLFALYGLDEVERVEALERQADTLAEAFLHHPDPRSHDRLNEAQRTLIAKLRATDRSPGMSVEQLATFPGMPLYNKVS